MTKKPHRDFSYEDYREIHTVMIEEKLTKDEIEEGLEAEIYDIHICLTSHSLFRMNDDAEREIEWDEIEPIILGVGEGILNLRDGEIFEIFSKEGDVKVAGITRFYDGKINLVVKTVVRILLSDGSYKSLKPTRSRRKENTVIRSKE